MTKGVAAALVVAYIWLSVGLALGVTTEDRYHRCLHSLLYAGLSRHSPRIVPG